MYIFGHIHFLTFLTGPDLQKLKFWPNLTFDIFDRSGPAKMEILAKFNF